MRIMKIEVQCYARKAEGGPVRFSMGQTVLFIESIQDRWNGDDNLYFRVVADDGNSYVIGHHQKTGEWTLESFRARELAQSFIEN